MQKQESKSTLKGVWLEKDMAIYSGICAWGNPCGQRSLAGYCPAAAKDSDTTEGTKQQTKGVWQSENMNKQNHQNRLFEPSKKNRQKLSMRPSVEKNRRLKYVTFRF